MKWILGGVGLFFVCFFEYSSSAKVYDWVEMHPEDIQIIENAKVEVEFRLDLIKDAKKTIDLITFDQRSDSLVGMPLLKALREAAERGVQVRLITSWFSKVTTEGFEDASISYLTDIPAKMPVQHIVVGGNPMLTQGWALQDGVHEKLLVIDGEDREAGVAFVTGRGNADSYLKWLDTAFVFRGPLMAQSQEAFNELWNWMREADRFPLQQARPEFWLDRWIQPSLPEYASSGISHLLTADDRAEINKLNEWKKSQSNVEKIDTDEKIRGRLLHHDLLSQVRSLAYQYRKPPVQLSGEFRNYYISDLIMLRVAELIRKERDMRFFSLALLPHPDLLQALFERAENDKDFNLQIMTNSKEAHETWIVPMAWWANLMHIEELLEKKGVSIWGLSPKKSMDYEYLHRKLLVAGDYVIFGSHNLTYASSNHTDEMSFEIESSTFSDKIRQIFEKSKDHAKELKLPKVSRRGYFAGTLEWLAKSFIGFI